MTDQIRVLSASGDPKLNAIRADLLRGYGLSVTTVESLERATKYLDDSLFDVLIFGSTLPKKACLELATVFRQRSRDGKIVEVIPSYSDAPKNQPDAIIAIDDEKYSLVSIIIETLKPLPSTATQAQWKELCKLAAMEQDPRKLLELVEEINRLLDEEREMNKSRRRSKD